MVHRLFSAVRYQLDAATALEGTHQLAQAAALRKRGLNGAPQSLGCLRKTRVQIETMSHLERNVDVLDHEIQFERIVEAAIQYPLSELRAANPRHPSGVVQDFNHHRRIESILYP